MTGIKSALSTSSSAIRPAPEAPAAIGVPAPTVPDLDADQVVALLEERRPDSSGRPTTSGLTQGTGSTAGGGLLGFLGTAASASGAKLAAPALNPGTVQTSKGWGELPPDSKNLLSQMFTSSVPLAVQQKTALQKVVGSAEWAKMTPEQQKDELLAKLKPFRALRGMQSSTGWGLLNSHTQQRLTSALSDPKARQNADILGRMVETEGFAQRDAKAQAGLLLQELDRKPDGAKIKDPGTDAALKRLKAQPAARDIDFKTGQQMHRLLTAKTNPYSKEARIELERRTRDPVYAVMTQAERTKRLAEIASGATAAPYLVSSLDVEERTPVDFQLEQPVARPAFKFRGATRDASERDLKVHQRTIPIFSATGAPIPKQNTSEEVARALAAIPAPALRKVKQVVINPVRNPEDGYWAKTFNVKDFRAAMTATTDGSINIFPAGSTTRSQKVVTGTIAHEAGHLLAYEAFGETVGGPGWERYRQAVAKDGVAPSGYGTGNLNEDFAETLQLYVTRRGTVEYAELSTLFPARFAVVEDVLAGRIRWTPPPTSAQPAVRATGRQP